MRSTVYRGRDRPRDCRYSCRRVFASLSVSGAGSAAIRGSKSLRMTCSAASRPPSRNTAPQTASRASARIDCRRKPPVLSSPEPSCSSSPRPMAAATSASGSALTTRARRRLRSPSEPSGKRIEVAGDGQVEDGVAQELEPFVVAAGGAAVGQRGNEQAGVARLVASRSRTQRTGQSPLVIARFCGESVRAPLLAAAAS